MESRPPPFGLAVRCCARCQCQAPQFFALASEGALEEVCEACYLVGGVQGLLETNHDDDVRAEVVVLLRSVYEWLAAIELSRRSSA